MARGAGGPVYVPYALAGESVEADVSGGRAVMTALLTPSPARVTPLCPYFTVCGGCAVQHLRSAEYAAWKRGSLVTALAHAGVTCEVSPLIDARGEGRRRATFHARAQTRGSSGAPVAGFMRARSHEIIAIDACPVLVPALAPALGAARALAKALAHLGKPLDCVATATLSGIDIDLRGTGKIDEATRKKLTALAGKFDLARISLHGEIILARRDPTLRMGAAEVILPPGGFIQATARAEEILSGIALEACKGAARTGDFFSGLGTFALRLMALAPVLAVESDAAALAALSRAARSARAPHPVEILARDLFRQPLAGAELAGLEAAVFDPPRAGAQAQAQAFAASDIRTIVAISCNAASFSRDAAILISGGYGLESVTPVDQFVFSPHVEIAAVFRRKSVTKRGRRKSLLG